MNSQMSREGDETPQSPPHFESFSQKNSLKLEDTQRKLVQKEPRIQKDRLAKGSLSKKPSA